MFEVWKTYEIPVYLMLVALPFLKSYYGTYQSNPHISKLPHCIKVAPVDGS